MTLLLLFLACGDDKTTDDTAAVGTDDSADDSAGADDSVQESGDPDSPTDDSADDSADESTPPDDTGGEVVEVPEFHTAPLADLAELSSGECPDLTASGTSTFLSSGEDRLVTAIIPAGGTEGAPLVFFFHGLTTPDATPSPTEYTAEALDLQSVADSTGAVILLPEAPLRDFFGYEIFLWDVEGSSDADLVLYDDLRTCASNQLGVDLEQVSAVGFSGGALFNTWIGTTRADTLATFVELSGGSDVEVPFVGLYLSPYVTPAWSIPALVVSGGEDDVWPDPSLALVDFEAASDTLAESLALDGHYVARCHHNAGHTITTQGYVLTLSWIQSHRYGEPSPYETLGLGDDADWCAKQEP